MSRHCSCHKRLNQKPPTEAIKHKIEFISDRYCPGKPGLVLDPDVFLVISCLEVSTYVYFCYKKVNALYSCLKMIQLPLLQPLI